MKFLTPHLAILAASASSISFAEEVKKAPFEFHGYARLGTRTDISITRSAQEQGDGKFGLWTSRHVKELNYLRLNGVANLDNGVRADFETELNGGLPHQTNNWAGNPITVRNAYLEMPLESSQLWFGSRRMEYEDVRLFDQNPLSETTLFGGGFNTHIEGTKVITALGIKDNSLKANVAKDEQDPSGGNVEKTLKESKTLTFFGRAEIPVTEGVALKPTVIVTHTGPTDAKVDYKTVVKVNDVNTLVSASLDKTKAVTDFKVGTVLGLWGNNGWSNEFVYVSSSGAAADVDSTKAAPKESDKDYTLGFASSGDFSGLKDANLSIVYAAMIEYKMFKNDQAQLKIADDKLGLTADGTKKSKSQLKAAFGLQPVYFITDKFHAALDTSYSLTSKVAEAKPNILLVTPILRYAANKNGLGTPQIYTSVTYGKYDYKFKKDTKDKATDTLVTTQTGMEVWF